MKIFQVKYNTEYYCYYKAEQRESFNEATKLYKNYTDCASEVNSIEGIERKKVTDSLLKYFKPS